MTRKSHDWKWWWGSGAFSLVMVAVIGLLVFLLWWALSPRRKPADLLSGYLVLMSTGGSDWKLWQLVALILLVMVVVGVLTLSLWWGVGRRNPRVVNPHVILEGPLRAEEPVAALAFLCGQVNFYIASHLHILPASNAVSNLLPASFWAIRLPMLPDVRPCTPAYSAR